MINWDKELEKIFADPLLADVTAPKRKINSSDRLVAGFQQVMEFVETNNRLPQNCEDRDERRLYNQLQGILNDPEKKVSISICNCSVRRTKMLIGQYSKYPKKHIRNTYKKEDKQNFIMSENKSDC